MYKVESIPSYQEELSKLIEQLGEMLPPEQLAIFNADAEQLAQNYIAPLKLKEGDMAPGFILPNAKGESISLAEALKIGPVVLTFYRGAWCPYCNLQLNQFQQILPQIHNLGASFIAISPQTPDNSLSMKEKSNLQFEVLSDVGNTVASQYTTVFKNGDAPIKAMTDLGYDFHGFYGDDSGELPVPATFVISKERKIILAFSGGGDYRERIEPSQIVETLKDQAE